MTVDISAFACACDGVCVCAGSTKRDTRSDTITDTDIVTLSLSLLSLPPPVLHARRHDEVIIRQFFHDKWKQSLSTFFTFCLPPFPIRGMTVTCDDFVTLTTTLLPPSPFTGMKNNFTLFSRMNEEEGPSGGSSQDRGEKGEQKAEKRT